jgi:uncharacterized protein YceH (UPF0502 family)
MLQPPLTPLEVRILGSLAEKAVITPDTYPLSLAGLLAACNQATSRDPVMHLDEDTVMQGVVSLRRRSLLRAIQPAGSRVTKYQHLLDETLDLDPREVAVLGVLMLRGEQTLAELFTRTTRLASFADASDVNGTLQSLAAREPDALVALLPRRPGQKEQRFAHLIGGPPEARPEQPIVGIDGPDHEAGTPADRVATLEKEVAELRTTLSELRDAFEAFRRQFG